MLRCVVAAGQMILEERTDERCQVNGLAHGCLYLIKLRTKMIVEASVRFPEEIGRDRQIDFGPSGIGVPQERGQEG